MQSRRIGRPAPGMGSARLLLTVCALFAGSACSAEKPLKDSWAADRQLESTAEVADNSLQSDLYAACLKHQGAGNCEGVSRNDAEAETLACKDELGDQEDCATAPQIGRGEQGWEALTPELRACGLSEPRNRVGGKLWLRRDEPAAARKIDCLRASGQIRILYRYVSTAEAAEKWREMAQAAGATCDVAFAEAGLDRKDVQSLSNLTLLRRHAQQLTNSDVGACLAVASRVANRERYRGLPVSGRRPYDWEERRVTDLIRLDGLRTRLFEPLLIQEGSRNAQ